MRLKMSEYHDALIYQYLHFLRVYSDDILEREQNIRIYRMITRKIPTFEATIPAFIENPEQLNDLSSVVRSPFIYAYTS